jgi:hypothetical protein
MPRGTAFLIIALTAIAFLLIGINFGKTLSVKLALPNPIPSPLPTSTPSPTLTPVPTEKIIPTINISIYPSSTSSKGVNSGTSTFTDGTCGISFTIPGGYLRTSSQNGKSSIFTDPNDPNAMIAATCASQIPRPPLPAEKVEAILLDGVAATLYHDSNAKDGSPRDEIIAKHPTSGQEVFVAGYGETFQRALKSFKFTTPE